MLAERASSAASALTEDAAFAVVEEQVSRARSLFVDLGVARAGPLSLLTDAERRPVVEATSRMKTVLDVISEATDEELGAYASASPEKRGSLLAVSRQASALRADLIAAQQALLRRLADEVWPEHELSRLDVMSHLSGNPTVAETARRIERIHQRVTQSAVAADVGLGASELDSLLDEATSAAPDAEQLRSETIPDDVLEFWDEASAEDGAPLGKLTPTVRAWLEGHDALNAFHVRRVQ